MTAEVTATVVWRCPSCGEKWQSEWALTCHIVGMARTYDDEHEEWVSTQLPSADLVRSSLLSVAHQLRPFITGTIQPLVLPVGTNVIENLGLAYAMMAKVELALHKLVVSRLQGAYGDDEKEWWVRRVDEGTRKECAARREDDPKRLDAWLYLNLVELGKIVEKNRPLFSEDLAALTGDQELSKKTWNDVVRRLNTFRNEVMHPLRGQTWDEGDFQFVRRWMERLDTLDT